MTGLQREASEGVGPARGAFPPVAWAVVAGAASLLFQLPFFDRWFSVMDEGHMLEFADIVADGGRLYRDATSYPLPGAFYLLAAAFELAGPSIRISRWLVALEFAGFVACVLWLLARIVPLRWALAGVPLLWIYRAWAFPHWQMYNYSTTALLLYVASLAALAGFLSDGRRRVLAASGLLFGLGVFCKQDYGAAMLLATLATLAVHARALSRRFVPLAACFLGPAAAVGAAAGVHFWLQGQLGFVVQLTVLNHFVGLSSYEYQAFPPLLPLLRPDPAVRGLEGLHLYVPGLLTAAGFSWSRALESPLFATAVYDTAVKAFIYGPALLLAGGALRIGRRRRSLADAREGPAARAELALFATAASLFGLAHVYRPQDYLHLAVLYWPLPCLVLVWTRALAARGRAGRSVAALLALAALALGLLTGSLLWRVRSLHTAPVPGERAGILAQPEQAHMLGEVVGYVRANSRPGEPVAAMPYFPIAQFLADRRGPHAASYIVWPFPEYPDRDRRIIDAMERTGTSLVIWNFTQFPNFPPVSAYAPELYGYLVDNFELERTFGDTLLGFRLGALHRSRPPEGRPLLADLDGAALFVESADGTRRRVPPDRRARSLARQVWPFRPVLALRPAAGGRRAVLSQPLSLAAPARLHTAVGVHPDLWFVYPTASVHFEVRVRDAGESALLFAKTLDPHRVLEDRGWFEVDVPLDAWTGRPVAIELSAAASGPGGEHLGMGGFAEPRLVDHPAP